jgi:PIF1-like helicase
MPAWIDVAKSNQDVQLTPCADKILRYMTKYIAKSEATMSRACRQLILEMACRRVQEDGANVPAVWQGLMMKILGDRTRPKQESCHLMMSQPTVYCSHTFFKVHLDNNQAEVVVDGDAGEQGESATKVTLMDAYEQCADSQLWANEAEFAAFCETDNEIPSLRDFCHQFQITRRGKIAPRISTQVIIRFMPVHREPPGTPNYWKVCRYALIKYKPWCNRNQSSLWGDLNEPTEQDYIDYWEAYLEEMNQVNPELYQFLQKWLHSSGAQEAQVGIVVDAMDPGDDAQDDQDDQWQGQVNQMQVLRAEDLLEDAENVVWDNTHDWSIPEHEYDNLAALSPQYVAMVADRSTPEYNPVPALNLQLNQGQTFARDMILDLVQSEGAGKLGILNGKGGTGKSTCIWDSQHTLEMEYGVGCVAKLAPTGKAASVINGSTLHNKDGGLALPMSPSPYTPLNPEALTKAQERFANLKLVIIDEYSMLKQRELFDVHWRLVEISGLNELFGGYAVLLVGDPAQIAPVLG